MRRLRTKMAELTARHWLFPGRTVVIDTETTDLDGQIIEIAAIEAATARVLVSTLIKPTCRIADEATAVHGITNDMVDTAPPFDEVWTELRAAMAGRTLAAWNAPFDAGMIERECDRIGAQVPRVRWRCVMRLDAQWRGTRRWRALHGGHRALGDTLAARAALTTIAGV